MKTLTAILLAAILSGCTSSRFAGSNIVTKPNCQDYANAWARQARAQGLVAGVVWYERANRTSHAINWINDGGNVVLIEPQWTPVRRVTLDAYESKHILDWAVGPSLGKGTVIPCVMAGEFGSVWEVGK